MNKFKNKQGLTQYAFACGHVQREKVEKIGYHNEVDLFLNGGIYTITVSRIVVDSNRIASSDRVEWLCFDSLTDARNEYKKQIKLSKAGRYNMNKIIESEEFDIILTKHKDYKGASIYRLCYGLQVETFDCLRKAINSFNGCLEHALDCGGY